KRICDGMKTGPNYKPAVFESHFIYKNLKTGDTLEFTDKNYPWQDTLNWAFHRALPAVQLSPEVDGAKIVDFSLTDLDGNSLTDSILGLKGYNFYIICYDLDKTNNDAELHAKINDFYTLCEKEKIKGTSRTASSPEQIGNFKHAHNAMYEFANDVGGGGIKITRSNP